MGKYGTMRVLKFLYFLQMAYIAAPLNDKDLPTPDVQTDLRIAQVYALHGHNAWDHVGLDDLSSSSWRSKTVLRLVLFGLEKVVV